MPGINRTLKTLLVAAGLMLTPLALGQDDSSEFERLRVEMQALRAELEAMKAEKAEEQQVLQALSQEEAEKEEEAESQALRENREARSRELAEAAREEERRAREEVERVRMHRTAMNEEMRAELQAARAELAAAARKLAETQRNLVEERAEKRHFSLRSGDRDGDVHIVMDDDHPVTQIRPRLGVVLGRRAQGREVLALTPGGGAEAAGLRAGDRLLEINGMALKERSSIYHALRDVQPGELVPVLVERDGEQLSFSVETSAPDRAISVFANRWVPDLDIDVDIDFDDIRQGLEDLREDLIGLNGELPEGILPPNLPGLYLLGDDSNLVSNHPGLAGYFGTGDGVIVLRIGGDNSLGLADGDVILRIDDVLVSHPVDLGRVILERDPGDVAELEIMRGGETLTLEGQVPPPMAPAAPEAPGKRVYKSRY